MSELNKLTPEMMEAFDACETKEELLAKAAELGVELTEEDVAVLMDEAEGELDDDELDAVAGGKEYKNGYKIVKRRDKCTIGQWKRAAIPSYDGVKDNGKCGNCEYGKVVNCKRLICTLQPEL